MPKFLYFVYQFLHAVSTRTNNGVVGGGASANALVASAPHTCQFVKAARAQNKREADCSRLAACVLHSVTDPFRQGDPLQTHLAFSMSFCFMM